MQVPVTSVPWSHSRSRAAPGCIRQAVITFPMAARRSRRAPCQSGFLVGPAARSGPKRFFVPKCACHRLGGVLHVAPTGYCMMRAPGGAGQGNIWGFVLEVPRAG